MKTCALIPGFNEEAHIEDVVKRSRPLVDAVLVVDDGSSDKTAAVAREAGAEILQHDVNQGKGLALRHGLDRAVAEGFDAAITLDADGQHIPEEIPLFLAAAAEADIVVGNRMGDVAKMPWLRLKTNQFTSWVVSRLAGVHVADSQVGFRLIRTTVWQEIADRVLSCNYDFESEILVAAGRAGFRLAEVPVSTVYGDETSSIHPVRDTIRFFSMVWRLSWQRRAGAGSP